MSNPIVLEIRHTQTGEKVEFHFPEEVGATMGHSRAMRYEIGLAAQWLGRAAKSERMEQHMRILRDALSGLLPWIEHEEPGPGEVGENFRRDLATARAALEATKGEE